MPIVPFLFFLLLTIYWWYEHKGADICVYMSALYAFSTMLAAGLLLTGNTQGTAGEDSGGMLWAGWEPVIGFIPTLSFVTLLGLSIWPFSLIYSKEIKNIHTQAPWTLTILSALLILIALVNLYCVAGSTLEILSGDLSFIREGAYTGEMTPADLKSASLPFPLNRFAFLNFITILALPIMFYNVCFENKHWLWNALLLFASLTRSIAGIQHADRTEPIFFAQMFLFCVILFHKFFTKRFKIALSALIATFTLIGAIYISAVSIARFDDNKEGGALTSVTQYAGQGFLNYTYFCEYGNFASIESEREFPILNHFLNGIDSNADRRSERSAQQGFFVSVFGTFIGDILLDLGPIGMVLWVLSFTFISLLVIRQKHRKEFELAEILIIFVLGSIPTFGVFYYRYYEWRIALVFVTAFIFWLASNNKIVFEKKEAKTEEE